MNEKIAQSWPHCQAPLCENLFFCPSEQIYFVALQCSNELLFAIMSTNFLDRLESAGVLLCVAWLLNAAVEFDLSRFSPLLTRFFQEKHLIQFLANKMQDFGISFYTYSHVRRWTSLHKGYSLKPPITRTRKLQQTLNPTWSQILKIKQQILNLDLRP